MSKIELDKLMNLDNKKEIADELGQSDLIKLFENYKPTYKPIVQKKSPLDQQISIGITKLEKDKIQFEIDEMRKAGEKVTISSVVRSRAIGEIDIQSWKEHAEEGLRELEGDGWNLSEINNRINKIEKLIADVDNVTDEIALRKELEGLKLHKEELEKPIPKKSSRMSGRVTFNEANHIRWRASRLTLTVADYMRFMIFGYHPFSDEDRHLSIDSRKRFYLAVIDVANNGWGNPPHIEECPNCARYAQEVQELRKKLERMKKFNNANEEH